MKPLFFILHSGLNLLVLPDTLAHLNGHTVITETYSIFKTTEERDPQVIVAKENVAHLADNDDPDYLGLLRFEIPDKLFSYVAAGGAGWIPKKLRN